MKIVSSEQENPKGFKLRYVLERHQDVIFKIAWSPDGKFLASPSRDKTINIWDIETGKVVQTLESHRLRVNSVAWSQDGKQLISGSSDKSILLWDIQSQTLSSQGLYKLESSILDLAWSPDNHTIAIACEDSKIYLYDFQERRLIKPLLEDHSAGVNSLAWSPLDASMFASASADRTIKIWNSNERKCIKTLKGHVGKVNTVAWSPDGKLLASGAGQSVKLWRPLETEQLIRELRPFHDSFVKSVDFSCDGKFLVSKSQDNTVRLWGCDTWEMLASLPESTTERAANGVAFHPQKLTLATLGENDSVIRVWDLDVDRLLSPEDFPKPTEEQPIQAVSVNPVEPPWIFGMHDPGDWRDLFEEAGKKGWVMFNQVVGYDASNQEGNSEFAEWTKIGYGVLTRLVNATFNVDNHGKGSIPLNEDYGDFAQRCANFVRNSPGCRIWFIGNEMNLSWHWPSEDKFLGSKAIPITPEKYTQCFNQVYKAIKNIQPDAWIIPSGLNPLYKPGGDHEDALKWFEAMLNQIDNLDGFDIHAYFPEQKSYSFRKFLEKIPSEKKHLPVFLTEVTPHEVWPEQSDGWMQRTFKEIDEWNQTSDNQKIFAVLPYRWQRQYESNENINNISKILKSSAETIQSEPNEDSWEYIDDPWNLADKPSYRNDLRKALENDYRWAESSENNTRLGNSFNKTETENESNNEEINTNDDSHLISEEVKPQFSIKVELQDIPTQVTKDQSIRSVIQVRNSGSTTWNIGKKLKVICQLKSTDEASQPTSIPPSIWTWTLAQDVLPNNTVEIPGEAYVSVTPGEYTTQWKVEGVDWEEPIESDWQSKNLTVNPASSDTSEPEPLTNLVGLVPIYEPPEKKDKITVEVHSETIELLHYNKKYSGPNKIDGQAILSAYNSADWKKYGELLFQSIIHMIRSDNSPLPSTEQGYRYAKPDQLKRLRFELELDPNNIGLREHKWEYLKDPQYDLPLAVYESSPFYRRQGNINSNPVTAKPLKILVAICNPTTLEEENEPNTKDLVKLDPAMERGIIETGLEQLRDKELIEYEFLDGEDARLPATIDNLRKKLSEGYHVLHIIAHGLFVNGKYYLVMESEDRRHNFVAAEQFTAPLLGDKLRLVVLASCQSAQTDTENAVRGLGPELLQQLIPAVIAMQDLVPVTTAQLFTQYFYNHLARSGRIDMAMAATRFDLYRRREGRTGDWAIPVLFMGTSDGNLFEVDREKSKNLEPLKPEVKTYEQLPGKGDPRPQKLAKAIEKQAQRYGANPEQIATLSSVATSTRLDTKPLAPQQNREQLTKTITAKVEINADELAEQTKKTSQLSLPSEVYQQVASALNTNKHIILIGPPGTGKTSIAHAICQYVKAQNFSAGTKLTTATADWTTFDTIGGYVPTPQQTLQFRLGIFLQAICDGHWLVIDEINRAEIDKAFGELFTVLAGQGVDLPYTVNDLQVRILPASNKEIDSWLSKEQLYSKDYNYVMHPNWRIIGTMNVYDKSFLFNMSFAFMRRFAFIDVDAPTKEIYETDLLEKWLQDLKSPDNQDNNQNNLETLKTTLLNLLDMENYNPLMNQRTIGPAIIKDMINYISDRQKQSGDISLLDLCGEAFLLYVVPQLDGLDREAIQDIYKFVAELFKDITPTTKDNILKRICLLYPHIRQWPKVDNQ